MSTAPPPSSGALPPPLVAAAFLSTIAFVLAPASARAETAAPEVLQPASDCRQPGARPRCADGFCRIPAGCFVMGAPRNEPGAARYADRQVQVTLTRPFLIGQTEVTRKQWTAAGFPLPTVPALPGEPPPPKAACRAPSCPVEGTSFFDALAFANRSSEQRGLPACYLLEDCTGLPGAGLTCAKVKTTAATPYECPGFRLPTEAEWEYAARAGTPTAFFTGGLTARPDADCIREPRVDPIGWYCHNAARTLHPVARKRPNPWGLYDVVGNVAEWCNDLKSPAGYGDGPLIDPLFTPRPRPDLRPETTHPQRVVRGGTYGWPASMAKASWRASLPDDTVGPYVGLRLARTAEP